ncbi:hypothetical protein QBC38DRAFT_16209 [Podospora fimiseda]|uniref:Uncharacterized protein n=1 Tax=Podospora fimiseda TaxID=252190 RepID=A0AAN7BJK4_9PEZI|nr:hypothetical protein QBC38DRAFT_16209 [Podospora fimiseda]
MQCSIPLLLSIFRFHWFKLSFPFFACLCAFSFLFPFCFLVSFGAFASLPSSSLGGQCHHIFSRSFPPTSVTYQTSFFYSSPTLSSTNGLLFLMFIFSNLTFPQGFTVNNHQSSYALLYCLKYANGAQNY